MTTSDTIDTTTHPGTAKSLPQPTDPHEAAVVTSAPTAATTPVQPGFSTPVLAPTPTTIHTSELDNLKLTVTEMPSNLPEYDRHDWKHWTDADGDCQDARNEALVTESRAPASYRTDRRCRVAAGEWLAPYTSTIVTDPSKLDVDHMVPLGNAHDSGAWRWSAQQEDAEASSVY